jgi:hypothetical protein
MAGKLSLGARGISRIRLASTVAACACSAISIAMVVIQRQGGALTEFDLDLWRPVALFWGVCAVLAAAVTSFPLKQLSTETSNVPGSRPLKPSRKLLPITATFAVVLAFLFPSLSLAVARAFERQWPAVLSPNTTNAALNISIDCDACAYSVENVLRKDTLAEKAEVDWRKGRALIWFDPQKTSLSSLTQTLKSHGFEVTGEK